MTLPAAASPPVARTIQCSSGMQALAVSGAATTVITIRYIAHSAVGPTCKIPSVAIAMILLVFALHHVDRLCVFPFF